MKTKQVIVFGLSLIGCGLFLVNHRGYSEPPPDRIVRLAELEIYPDQVNAYKAALKEEIATSIRVEPGALTLYAVSVKDHPEQIRLFETYSNQASYGAHLQAPHFKKYKEQTQRMVKSLSLLETHPILLGSKFKMNFQTFIFELARVENLYLQGGRAPARCNAFNSLSSAIASSCTPRRISLSSTEANPNGSPSHPIRPRL